MLSKENPYCAEIPEVASFEGIPEGEITNLLEGYLKSYDTCFVRSQQIKYFRAFEKGLLSNLDRKSIEPIALSFLGEKEVRGMQQFFTRSKGWDVALKQSYQKQLGKALGGAKGFLSADESDFVKKGKDSAGVARQYCGRLGKRENCQAGVFVSYATEKGIGLVDASLYLPKGWFDEDHASKREECQIPEEMSFKTKNEMAREMISRTINSGLFPIYCVGCDASFGCDHTFLDSLPESIHYFASVRKDEYIFRNTPSVAMPENSIRRGGRIRHPRPKESRVQIRTILDDETIPWIKKSIAEGTKGPVIAEIKCLRCRSCRKEKGLYIPKEEIFVYIRKYEDGTVKYFVSNMPAQTSQEELDALATMRWSIEQCFQECKSYLGMTHYETRSYQAWHRHMLLVMIAHLFVTLLRHRLKKICTSYHAHDPLSHCLADSSSL